MIRAADNLQILQPSIRVAVDREDPEPIAALVRRLAAAGAEAIDNFLCCAKKISRLS